MANILLISFGSVDLIVHCHFEDCELLVNVSIVSTGWLLKQKQSNVLSK